MDAADASHRLFDPFECHVAGQSIEPVATRGVLWVLQWFAALASFCLAGVWLADFAYCVAAERAVARAANAGALEATLPRATYHSVRQVVERRLGGYSAASVDRACLSILQDGRAVRGPLRDAAGSRLTIAVTVPTDAMMPRWLRTLAFWQTDATIHATLERRTPGRRLTPP